MTNRRSTGSRSNKSFAATPVPPPKGRRAPFVTRAKPMKEKAPLLFGAIDTETYNLNGRLLIAQSAHEAWNGAAHVYRTAAELLEHIFSLDRDLLKNTVWFAHNAEYDWRYLLDAFEAWGRKFEFVPCERANGKFYEIRVLSKTEKTASGTPLLVTRFRDSMALFPRSLKELTSQFAPQYVKQDIGFDSGVVFDPDNPRHIEYAKNDVKGLVAALIGLDEKVYSVFGAHCKGTTAATGYQAMLRFLPEGERYYRQARVSEEFFRLGYYGGLVQLNAPHGAPIGEVKTFDRNSSYPAAMRHGVPKGKARFTTRYREGFPGFYRVRARVPQNAIMPIIPFRSDRNELAWPTGEFDTIVTSLEIEYGRTLGYEFEIGHGYYFPEGMGFPFNDFVDKCEKLRAEYKGTPTETVVKLIQNSVYGRFGMKLEGRECCISFDGVPAGFEPLMDEETGRLVDKVYFRTVERDSEYMLPHFAAWITANARIALDKDAEAAGRAQVRYRDTDSISVEGAILPELLDRVSNAYGDLKDEGVKSEIAYHAPKCYTYRDPKGRWKAVYKGIPKKVLNEELILALHRGDPVKVVFNSTTSVQTFIRTGRLEIRRTRSPTNPEMIYGHRIENGWFRPRHIQAADAGRGRAA